AATPEQVQLIVTLINQERSLHGLAPLALDLHLTQAAQAHSEDMAMHNFVGHNGSGGGNYWDRVTATGYVAIYVGEVITAGQTDVHEVVQAWINSPPHHDIILHGDAIQL